MLIHKCHEFTSTFHIWIHIHTDSAVWIDGFCLSFLIMYWFILEFWGTMISDAWVVGRIYEFIYTRIQQYELMVFAFHFLLCIDSYLNFGVPWFQMLGLSAWKQWEVWQLPLSKLQILVLAKKVSKYFLIPVCSKNKPSRYLLWTDPAYQWPWICLL